MALSDISPRGILSGIEEFDRLGRDAFLETYGFGPSREYFLLHKGERYDSKAIVGYAHGIDRADIGPLTGADFSGGLGTVVPLLRDLGFSVVDSAGRLVK